jgi:hypothetical protein
MQGTIMLNISKVVLIICFTLISFQTSSFADSDKGLKLFRKELRKACGYSGNVMAKKHTQAEWKGIYEAGNLNNALIKECPKFKPTKEASLADIYDFLYEYAVDSGNTALCN